MAETVELNVSSALVSRYIDVATTALVFYDWATALGDEINLIWTTPSGSLPKYCFITLRYTTLATQPITLLYDFFVPASRKTCISYERSILALTYIVLGCTELIIMLRLFTSYRGNKVLYRSIWLLYFISMIIAAVMLGDYARHLKLVIVKFQRAPDLPVMDILPGCWSVVGNDILFVAFGLVVAWEIGISLISFWKTWNTYVSTGTPFWQLFYKSGNHFYLWILGISFVNIGLIAFFQSKNTSNFQDRVVFSLIRTVHSVCVARLLLHVRNQAHSGDENSLTQSQPQSFQLTNTRSNDEQRLTTPENTGLRLRDAWEEMKKRRKDPGVSGKDNEPLPQRSRRASSLLFGANNSRHQGEEPREADRTSFQNMLLRMNSDVTSHITISSPRIWEGHIGASSPARSPAR